MIVFNPMFVLRHLNRNKSISHVTKHNFKFVSYNIAKQWSNKRAKSLPSVSASPYSLHGIVSLQEQSLPPTTAFPHAGS